MTDETPDSVLRRKTRSAAPALDIAPMSPRKAFRQAASKSGDRCNGLELLLSGHKEERLTLDPLLENLPKSGLYLRLNGPGEATGFAVLDGDVVAALIEQQTVGRVISGEAPDRPATQTDAMMCVPFLNDLLASFAQNLKGLPDWDWAHGFSFGARLNGPRALGLVLEDIAFRLTRLSLDFGAGARTGDLLICLPANGRAVGGAKVKPGPDDWTEKVARSVASAEVSLNVVLGRQSISLARVEALSVGDVIEIPRETLTTAVIETPAGSPIASGRIGQINGYRAIRLEPELARAAAKKPAPPPPMPDLPSAASVGPPADMIGPPAPPIGADISA